MSVLRPTWSILWEGRSLEELGIADAFTKASLTITVCRTAPSKKFKSGKPKVGGASLEFNLSNRQIAHRIAELLHVSARPQIVFGFGYEGDAAYWHGGFGPFAPTNVKDYHKSHAFRMEKPKWTYGESGATVVLSGLSEKTFSLVESVKPRVYDKTTLRAVLDELGEKHGFRVDIDPEIGPSKVINGIIKTSDESDLDFIVRLGEMHGAYSVYMDVEDGKEYHITRTSGGAVDMQQARTTVRNVLRMRKLPAYVSMGEVEQFRPVVIGFGPMLSDADRARCDYFAKSVSIEEEGGKAGAQPAGAGVKSDNGYTVVAAKGEGPLVAVFETFDEYKASSSPGYKPGMGKGQRRAQRTKDESVDGAPPKKVVLQLPDELGMSALESDRMQAIAIACGISLTYDIEITPGVPYLQAPMQIRLMGTDAHDGLLGIEESTIELGANGLTTKLKCKPLNVAADPAETRKRVADAGMDVAAKGEGPLLYIKHNATWEDFQTGRSSPIPDSRRVNPEQPAVPYEPDGVAGDGGGGGGGDGGGGEVAP